MTETKLYDTIEDRFEESIMKPKETKFAFIYNEIKQRIVDGHILPGHSLPSSRLLSYQFHVSRYTINRVFDALREEGYIEIRPRLAPIVVSRKDSPRSSEALSDILKQRDSIMQVYQTFATIMPPLLVFASRGCDLEIMPHYKQAMKVSRLGIAAGGWRPPSNLGCDILKVGGNPLFSELYSTFDLYNKLTFFTEECPYFSEHFMQGALSAIHLVIGILKGDDPSVMHSQLSIIYQKLSDSVASTLEYLSSTYRCV